MSTPTATNLLVGGGGGNSSGIYTLPAARWCFEEKIGSFAPFTEEESQELEQVYQMTKGRGALYLDTHTKEEKFVDFYKKTETRKGKQRKVVRGTWFYENDDGLLVPYPEETAKILEERYQMNPSKFEKLRVTAEPARFVEQRADGTFRQYRHTKNGTIQGRKVVRGYDNKLLVVDPETIDEYLKSPYPNNLLPTSPRDTDPTATVRQGPTASTAIGVRNPRSSQNRSDSIKTPLCNSPTPNNPTASNSLTSTLSSTQSKLTPVNSHTRLSSSSSSGGSADAKLTLTRQRTIAAKEKLVELGLKLAQPNSAPTMTQEEILSEANLKVIIKRLTEENAFLKAKIEALTKTNAVLTQQLHQYDVETRELEVMVVEKEMEVEDKLKTIVEKEKLIENLMNRIRNITGKSDVFIVSDDNGAVPAEGTNTMLALQSLANVLDKADDTTKSNLMTEFSSIFENFTKEDFDEFADILSVDHL